jgi:hypothetical protein
MLPPRYDEQKAIENVESRHRERHLRHALALKGRERDDGIISRVVGLLVSLRPAFARRAVPTTDEHGLTDYVCRLDDGSMGRVVMRESEGEWIAVCVRAA